MSQPTKGHLVRLQRIMTGRYSFSVKDVARVLKRSIRSAERYIALLKELGVIELRYRDSDRYYHYRIRRKK